jgi:hypothetical protein
LAVVEGTVDGQVEDVLVGDGRHLSFLDRRNSSLRVEDKDRDILLRSKTVDGSAVHMTRIKTDSS